MKDVDLIRALRHKSMWHRNKEYYDTARLLDLAVNRLEQLTKQPEPHPQQLWNTGRKGSEDYND